MQHTYEIMVLTKISLTKQEEEKIWDNLKKTLSGGKILEEKDMGKRHLAYPIKKEKDANYRLFIVETDGEKIRAVGETVRMDERILRHLCIRREK